MDILSEDRISITQLAKEQDISLTTCWRWIQHGVRGCILESANIGGRRFTSREAFQRFVEATTAAAAKEPTPGLRKSRQSAIEAAERECNELGIK